MRAAVGVDFDIVVPTIGRPSLPDLLGALAAGRGPAPERMILVDDRRQADRPLLGDGLPPGLGAQVHVLRGPAAGPAAARNTGWRAGGASWVAFLDDDVVPGPDWAERLVADLAAAEADVAGVQGRLRVPLPADRRPTDWERNLAGLEAARWATADMAYRRSALAAVGGFDGRFPRAFREDADLALRVSERGWRLTVGTRTASHPVRPASPWVSVRLQAGNADDALMRTLHGRGWHERAGAPPGRIARHVAVTAVGLAGIGAALLRRPRLGAAGLTTWAAGTAELAWARIAPGPRTTPEIATMAATSAVLPAVATWHRVAGEIRAARLVRQAAKPPAATAGGGEGAPAATEEGGVGAPPGGATGGGSRSPSDPFWHAQSARSGNFPDPMRGGVGGRPEAVLLDRDGTLVVDVPYNGDPGRVVPAPGARQALDRLRHAGVPVAVVSNQSGIARGLVTPEQVDAVNRRVEELLGPIGPWLVCPHGPGDGCRCRKPAAGLVEAAAAALGVPPERCAVIGDIGADMQAARAAGARGVLVPTPATRADEVAAAPEVAPDLPSAVDLLLGDR